MTFLQRTLAANLKLQQMRSKKKFRLLISMRVKRKLFKEMEQVSWPISLSLPGTAICLQISSESTDSMI